MTSPCLRAVFLGSGSAGNCTAVTDGDTLVLVDCGFSARETARRLTAAGLDPSRVAALLVTHEHGDHVRGIDVFVRRHAPAAVVYGTDGTLRAAGLSRSSLEWRGVRGGSVTTVGALSIMPFATSHDAAEPVGYRIDGAEASVGLLTDSGLVTPEAAEALSDVCVLGLEVNHDLTMLADGPYPAHLKRRIRSPHGHLSNDDAADALERLAGDRLQCVVALHRSRTNNTSALAAEALRTRLSALGHPARVHVAEQEMTTEAPATADGSGGS